MDGLLIGMAATRLAQQNSASMQAQTASAVASEARLQGESLAVDVDKLFLITEALWELLKKEHGYTDELLIKKVTEIDSSNGTLNGKAPKKERPNCVSCGRKLGRHPTCLYCGAITPRNPFER